MACDLIQNMWTQVSRVENLVMKKNHFFETSQADKFQLHPIRNINKHHFKSHNSLATPNIFQSTQMRPAFEAENQCQLCNFASLQV